MQLPKRFDSNYGDVGQTVVEYALVVGVVSLALILLVLPIGQSVITAMSETFSNFELPTT